MDVEVEVVVVESDGTSSLPEGTIGELDVLPLAEAKR